MGIAAALLLPDAICDASQSFVVSLPVLFFYTDYVYYTSYCYLDFIKYTDITGRCTDLESGDAACYR